MLRREVTTPDGVTYRLVAGWAPSVDREGAAPPPPAIAHDVAMVFAAMRAVSWLHRALWWRRRGRVALHTTGGRRRWVWDAPTARAARAAAALVADAVESGSWVPGTGPPPDVPGLRAAAG